MFICLVRGERVGCNSGGQTRNPEVKDEYAHKVERLYQEGGGLNSKVDRSWQEETQGHLSALRIMISVLWLS